ncbi:hypothetical protein PF010_g7343 [Phytophthora fragariae]|uniref:Secreted protein n=1 Tax=Phytophthora fragariae TaxID=53985 RepID=A0A6A3F3X9_9STRA|nr:hypothetical protein PF009_g9723 [Phytophthora fragariae]KAE9112064.1 hypothetical protein PF007_g11243 [Phytophthora fragariae]KAE9120850.1 hypothetical protein PF010_g7343 [Phytophthora fragariae]KAE9148692.1 hypothetical protein PF006_g6737 [Phytophthora fragariae]KAE9334663.1 hypothetical protein PF008_g13843 [Phytophthora fragariae]
MIRTQLVSVLIQLVCRLDLFPSLSASTLVATTSATHAVARCLPCDFLPVSLPAVSFSFTPVGCLTHRPFAVISHGEAGCLRLR